MFKIIFLCTGNSCRSQMAEGFAKSILQNHPAAIYSAGTKPQGLNPLAIKSMERKGIDISTQSSSHIDEYKEIHFTHVISVCDNAAASCPLIDATSVTRLSFDDPPKLSEGLDTIESNEIFDRVRDEIESSILNLAEDWCKDL
ncbi:MAG: arsenate reductase ArsC [Bdellovibrionales bacterium]